MRGNGHYGEEMGVSRRKWGLAGGNGVSMRKWRLAVGNELAAGNELAG